MDTSTSTIGTLICGSSSRGSITTANTPSSSDAITISSVSLESMNDCAMRPAMPRCDGGWGDDIILKSSKLQAPSSREAPMFNFQTSSNPHAVWCLVFEHSLELGAWNLELHFTTTGCPSAKTEAPSVTTCSPEFKPETSSISSPTRLPVLTRRNCAWPLATTKTNSICPLNHGCGGNADRAGLADGHGHATKLSRPQTRRARQIQFHQIRPTVLIGGGRHFGDRAFNFAGDGGDAHGELVAEFHS